jgi:primosomal protein N'
MAGVFSFIVGGLFLIGLVVFAFHARCPSCKGLFARKVLSKSYSHTATEQETTYEHGTAHTRTVHRRIYHGSFRCHRCGHTWSGYM